MNLTEKIISEHLPEKFKQVKFKPQEEISIKIDQTLTQDATGTLVYQAYQAMNPEEGDSEEIKTKLSVSYIDHNTLQLGFENSDDHRYLKSVAAKYGIIFSPPGNGICHQLHLENFAIPGGTLVGSDSHTCTMGAMAMLAFGAGGMDVAFALKTGMYQFLMPEVVNVVLKGQLNRTSKLKNYISAKDIILELLRRFTVKGGYNKIFEYSGEGIKYLDIYDRATICNMGAELGLTTSIFPSDEITKKFIYWCDYGKKRIRKWRELKADKNAKYSDIIEVDLCKLEPLIACPPSPDNVHKVSELEGKKVQQVCIGSCTNSSYKDLMIVANVLKDHRIHPDVELIISPGSKRIISLLEQSDAIKWLINSGARILEPACGPCIGMGQVPSTGSVSLRTFNRNFLGRAGTENAEIYLCSSEVAIASAIYGEITHPKKLKLQKISLPKRKFYFVPNFIYPPEVSKRKSIEIVYGPNIKPLPEFKPLNNKLSGEVIIKLPDNISTDDILPATPKTLSLRSNIPAIAEFAFCRIDQQFVKRAKALSKLVESSVKKCGVIIAGDNYGQGSSREHAAIVLRYLSIGLVIAKSFSRIHRANLINFGILPLSFKSGTDYENISFGDELLLDDAIESINKSKVLKITNKTKNLVFKVEHNLNDREKQIVFSGGLLNARFTKIS